MWELPLTSRICQTAYNSPYRRKAERQRSLSSELTSNSQTVARPVAVRPTTFGPSKAKCSSHRSWRGLNKRTTTDVSGSTLLRFGPLRSLHR